MAPRWAGHLRRTLARERGGAGQDRLGGALGLSDSTHATAVLGPTSELVGPQARTLMPSSRTIALSACRRPVYLDAAAADAPRWIGSTWTWNLIFSTSSGCTTKRATTPARAPAAASMYAGGRAGACAGP